MKLSELFSRKEPTLSFEVFPPKTDAKYESVKEATNSIAELKPDFMSVTYGAGGGTSQYTVSIAADILKNHGVKQVYHGHIHGAGFNKAVSEYDGVEFKLISCDCIDFTPQFIA